MHSIHTYMCVYIHDIHVHVCVHIHICTTYMVYYMTSNQIRLSIIFIYLNALHSLTGENAVEQKYD